MAAYLTVTEAPSLAANMPGTTALLVLVDDAMAALLLLASLDIDVAFKYQGRKFNGELQEREFPRIPYGTIRQTPGIINTYYPGTAPTPKIWDWDPLANGGQGGAVVPPTVQYATIWQAVWLLQPQFAARLEAIQSGLKQQSIGTASETFAGLLEVPGGFSGLGDRAARMLNKYRIRTGQLR